MDNFNIHKWNRDRYIQNLNESEDYEKALSNLHDKASEGLPKSDKKNKLNIPSKKSFKDVIDSVYEGSTSFIGDNKVYFKQKEDLDDETVSKLKQALSDNGFEIEDIRIDFEYEKGERFYYPYIIVKNNEK